MNKFNSTYIKASLILSFILQSFIGITQKPQKTHNHEHFVKKVVFAMGADITKWCADDQAMQYISENGGKSVGELKKIIENSKSQLKKDVEFLNNNNIYRNYQSISLKEVSKKPVVSDIVLHCENSDKKYDIILKNCVQTNISWYLGDRIIAEGEGLESNETQSKKDETAKNNGLLSRLEEKNDALEKKNTPVNSYAYVGKKFPMQGTQTHTQFFKMDLIGKYLDGYIIDIQGFKQEMKIKYDAPDILHDPNQKLLVDISNTKTDLSKNSLQAFYVGEQLFVYTGKFWDILLEEGAIKKLGRVVKDDQGNYITADLIQKIGMEPENVISLTVGFKNRMSEYVSDHSSLSSKIQNKEEGYKLKDIDEIIITYNKWYDEKYPDAVDYLFKPKKSAETEDPLEKLSKEIFQALKSENTENFKPYVFTMEDIENSSIKPEVKEMVKKEFSTDPKKSKAEWYGNKWRASNLIKEYQQTDTKNFKLDRIESIKSDRETSEIGFDIYDIKMHVKVNDKNGYLKFKSGKLGEYWKVLEMPHTIFNLNPTPEEETEEIEGEPVKESTDWEEAEEAEEE